MESRRKEVRARLDGFGPPPAYFCIFFGALQLMKPFICIFLARVNLHRLKNREAIGAAAEEKERELDFGNDSSSASTTTRPPFPPSPCQSRIPRPPFFLEDAVEEGRVDGVLQLTPSLLRLFAC